MQVSPGPRLSCIGINLTYWGLLALPLHLAPLLSQTPLACLCPFTVPCLEIHLNPEVLDGIRQLPRLQTYSLIIEWLAGQVQLVVLARLLASAALSV